MRLLLLLAAAAVLAGCGSKKTDPYARANVALLDRVPAYPGSAAPRTTTSGASNTQFGARDWTLPANATARAVVRWYEQALPKRGWKITGESFGTLRAVRGGAAISVGVRGRKLEITANSRGA
ncbi:MAG TPA: hypothetical protein VI408_02900 [Gaiellaceae bacterium]